MDAFKTVLIAIGSYTLVGVVLSVLQYLLGDRSGNSGRFGKHWSDED